MEHNDLSKNLPDTYQVDTEAELKLSLARQMQIDTPQKCNVAIEFIKGVKLLQKDIKKSFNPSIKKANDLHKLLVKERNCHLEPIIEAEKIAKGKIIDWQEREKARLRKEAEKTREKEEALRLEEAVKLEAKGKTVQATEVIEEVIEGSMIESYAPVPYLPKTKGVTVREDWDFAITDAKKLPPEYLIPDEKKIRAVVKALKGATRISGVKVFAKTVMAVKT